MRTMSAWLAWTITLAVACGTTREPEARAAAASAPVAAARDADTPAGAEAAYRGVVAAWNTWDADAYTSRFSSAIECWYGRRGVTAQAMLRARQPHFTERTATLTTIESLDVVEFRAGWAALRDRGYVGSPDRRHDRLIALRRVGDRWLIVAETPTSAPGCLDVTVTGGTASPGAPAGPLVAPVPDFLRETTPPATASTRCAMMVYRHCDGPGGGPPCRTSRQRPEEVETPPSTDGVTRETWPQHQQRFADWASNLGNCGEVEPQWDARGRLAELSLGDCMSAQQYRFAFSDCR